MSTVQPTPIPAVTTVIPSTTPAAPRKYRRTPDPMPGGPSRAVRYVVLRASRPEWSDAECARRAGYGTGVSGSRIAETAAARAVTETVDRLRTALQQVPETSIVAVVARLAEVLSAPMADDRARVMAAREVSAILGYHAPERLQVDARVLMADLASYTTDQIRAMRAALPSDAEVRP